MGAFPARWAVGWTFHSWLAVFIFVNALVTIAFYGLMMIICWKRVGATQFSIYMTGSNLGMSAGPVVFAATAGTLGYPAIFVLAAVPMMFSAGLVQTMHVDRHEERLRNASRPRGLEKERLQAVEKGSQRAA